MTTQATKWRYNNLRNTRIVPFFVSLLLANLLQAIGTLINGKWVTDRTVHNGPLCRAQAGIKQAGNVAMALWWVRTRLRPLIVRLTLLTACS